MTIEVYNNSLNWPQVLSVGANGAKLSLLRIRGYTKSEVLLQVLDLAIASNAQPDAGTPAQLSFRVSGEFDIAFPEPRPFATGITVCPSLDRFTYQNVSLPNQAMLFEVLCDRSAA